MWVKALMQWLRPQKDITAEQWEEVLRAREESFKLRRAQITPWHLPPPY